jgi:flagellar basal body-associated protein FliL
VVLQYPWITNNDSKQSKLNLWKQTKPSKQYAGLWLAVFSTSSWLCLVSLNLAYLAKVRAILLFILPLLLSVGCAEEIQNKVEQAKAKDDPSIPLLIPCEACKEGVAKKTDKCPKCGHPTADSVVAYKKAVETERVKRSQIKPEYSEIDFDSGLYIKFHEINYLICKLGGSENSSYLNINMRLEGIAGDFEKVLEMNEHLIRDRALSIMGEYTYQESQSEGFKERVRDDFKKAFSQVLIKYRDRESDMIQKIYFTQFVVQ